MISFDREKGEQLQPTSAKPECERTRKNERERERERERKGIDERKRVRAIWLFRVREYIMVVSKTPKSETIFIFYPFLDGYLR